MKRLVATASVLLVCIAPSQEFEVASVRQHDGPLSNIMDLKISGSRVTLGAYNIAQLILEAYHLKGMWQISFGSIPGHDDAMNVYYDIAARAPDSSSYSRDQDRKMLQILLADRFKLSLHHEMKQTPVYVLANGSKASKWKTVDGDADCSVHVSVVTGGQSYELLNCPVESLISVLGNGLVDRPVVDKTGLLGKYDFRFTATPLNFRHGQPELSEISPFSAMRDLGFKLQAQTEAMEILKVDHFEKPSPN